MALSAAFWARYLAVSALRCFVVIAIASLVMYRSALDHPDRYLFSLGLALAICAVFCWAMAQRVRSKAKRGLPSNWARVKLRGQVRWAMKASWGW
jgi:hypothetical protein